ncbi:hypothetical protein DAEQUDRAFT_719858 [Daedalea quercina L-15889]|uniref:Uncharacterized protein n=1 Tax=Daedalea quercina L-15889 TaxID=1314783 RepID=A0A165UBK3_9APHY|nr:hypothetical protein DAEQUDRAFT_719858 [Daedalea quercina L-15889]
MGFGSCTVSIFSCPASALGLGGPLFLSLRCSNPNPIPSNESLNMAVLVDELWLRRLLILPSSVITYYYMD